MLQTTKGLKGERLRSFYSCVSALLSIQVEIASLLFAPAKSLFLLLLLLFHRFILLFHLYVVSPLFALAKPLFLLLLLPFHRFHLLFHPYVVSLLYAVAKPLFLLLHFLVLFLYPVPLLFIIIVLPVKAIQLLPYQLRDLLMRSITSYVSAFQVNHYLINKTTIIQVILFIPKIQAC